MTELAIANAAKGLAAAAVGMMPIVAAIDVSTQNEIVELAKLGLTSLTAIAIAWIGMKQNALGKKQDEMSAKVDAVKTQTDGITKALVDSTAVASHAEGVTEGKQIAAADAALFAKGKLEGAIDQKSADEKIQ